MTTKNRNHDLMQFFRYDHLPERLQKISRPFGKMALEILETLPDNRERDTALRKLLESKDCAIRSFLFEPTEKA